MTSPSRFLSDIDTRFIHFLLSKNMSGEGSSLTNPLVNYGSDRYSSSSFGKTSFYGKTSHSHTNSVRTNEMRSLRRTMDAGSGIKPQHTADEVREGSVISHERFGKGTVIKLAQISGEDMITVDFGVVGIKKLLLKFAKFSIIRH